jgi:hypothetical protein
MQMIFVTESSQFTLGKSAILYLTHCHVEILGFKYYPHNLKQSVKSIVKLREFSL